MTHLENGQLIAGRYQVMALLGQGGMATVYKVWDNQRAAHLALKLLRADLAEDRVFLRRFAREAEVLEQLQHPNIVRFYGFEQYEREAFMLLEYVEGDTLRGRIFDAGGPLALAEVLWWLRPICGALHYAHNLGVAHCDIKPANMMVTQDGRMYLADFGIARMAESATTTAWSPGTPAYMSPEQCRGEELDPHTDIYSLGVTLYEMVTGGERPFTGDTNGTTGSIAERIRWQHFFETPPLPSRYNPDLPLEVEAVITRCLAKRREDRWPGALPLLRALEAASGRVERSNAPEGLVPAYQLRAAPVVSAVATPRGAPQSFPTSSLPARGSTPASTPVSNPHRQGLAVMVGALVLLLALIGGLIVLNRVGRERPVFPLATPTATLPLVAFVETPTATVTVQPTATPTVQPTATPEPSPTLPPGAVYYTVREGETLSMIAFSYDMTVATLIETNALKSADFIFAGQVLIIPPAPTSTATPTHTSTPTAPPPPPTATLEPPTIVATSMPRPTVTPQATSTPACPAVSGPFAAVWDNVQHEIGCATGSAINGLMAEENFESGMMFWREPIDYAQALVLFNNGTWRIFQHSPFVEGSPDFSCPDANTPPQCPPTPKRGFGMMWCNIPEIRSGLGNALDCERGYNGIMQEFERGFVLRTDTGMTYVFYANGRWERR